MKFSIFVGLFALFIGLFLYKFYLPISPKLSGASKAIVAGHQFLHFVGRVGEHLGIVSRAQVMRAAFDCLVARHVESETTIEDAVIAGVSVRIFRPGNESTQRQDHPGLIYFHGGGLVTDSKYGFYQTTCSKFSNATRSIVISVDYRLAPEHLFPAQFDDCYAVVSTVINNPTKFGIIKGKIAMGGDSAGGLLTAAISIELKKQSKSNEIAAQLLLYPWVQLIDVTYLSSYQEYDEGFLLSQEMMIYFSLMATTAKLDLQQEYLSGNVSRYFMCTSYWKYLEIPKVVDCENTTMSLPPEFVQAVTDPHLSPLLAESVEGLPPAFIMLAEYDVLTSECELFASRLKKSGVEVILKRYKSYHAFLATLGDPYFEVDLAKKAVDDIVDYLNFVFYNK